MTRRDDYSADEWGQLLAAPRVAGALVVVADLHVTGVLGEFTALAMALTDREGDGADNDLVQSLIDSMAETLDDEQDDPDTQDLDELRETARALLRAAAAIVDATATPTEAAGYRRWVLGGATATAEARKESAFLGIGGERVSADERDALTDIADALGVPDPA